MIYDIIGVDRDYQLVLKCRHPTEMNKFQPLVVRNDRIVARDTDVDDENERDEEDDAINTDEIHLPNDDENCCQIENIDLVMVQQVVECESTRFVNLEVGDRSNNPEVEFEAHQEFTVYRSNASVLVLQCKKAPECQWRLRAMTVKDTEMTITVAAIQAVVAEQFELPRFFLALEQSNPGCIMYSKMVPGNNPNEEIFQRVFWAFAPSIKGFAHCRPVLSIDGTHLYGKYKGTLLIAMGCDGNNQLFPLAFSITEGENTDSWSWFLACIRVGVTQRKGLCLISDRHPGIIAAVNETYSDGLSQMLGARNLPIIALVQLTFYLVNSYFTVRREHGASRLASGEEFTPHIDAKIKAKVVKAGAHEDSHVRTFLLLVIVEQLIFEICTRHGYSLFRARLDPEDTSVLTLQHQHRSSTIRVDPDMGFYVFHRVGHVKVDWPLITALVERWRPETHTFHMPVGEMTITLQDVAILFGLRVHGHLVTGSTDIDWHALCEELLGVRPTETDIRGASLTVRFITTHFSHLPPGVVDEVTLQRHARAYLLLLVSGSLFTDKKGVYIQLAILPMLRDFGETAQYSWGSATLAHLYRELCRASLDSAESIVGPLHLLQLWSWERLHVGLPSRSLPHAPVPVDERFPPDALGSRWRVPLSHTDTPHHVLVTYRDEFDRQRSDQIETMTSSYLEEVMHWRTLILMLAALHGGDRSLAQSTVARPPLVRGRSTSRGRVTHLFRRTISAAPYFFRPTISQPLTSSDPPSVQPSTSLDLPPLQPPISSDPPLVQIDTSTQLDLPPAIPRGRRGLRRPRLLPPPPPLFPALAPSQTDVLHVSHAVPATVREERPKKKRVSVTHRFSPCGGM
ncbi:Serine/threonine-protein phosphatase 7 long form-like [Vitis vinifera]|uniref:Serine/threonine-protein phosphatase 7 long form-like n=1 Tax=Vitis vinifera TaxID=29760 RepID=A0A438I3N2_VITVI|nr:Serine/threonine-protein phosphatase 7 long form-like [Vitis vinifera]